MVKYLKRDYLGEFTECKEKDLMYEINLFSKKHDVGFYITKHFGYSEIWFYYVDNNKDFDKYVHIGVIFFDFKEEQ